MPICAAAIGVLPVIRCCSSVVRVRCGANTSRGFTSWLKEQNASLTVTTYQVGKLFWAFNRNIGRCLGLAIDGDAKLVPGALCSPPGAPCDQAPAFSLQIAR